MKTINISILSLLLLFSIKSFAIVRIITQTGMSFSPSSLNVNVGDVIRWKWSDGIHTTTSKTIPAGAATWDAPLTSSQATFEYTVTVAGTYNYVCTLHESMGMVASFTATNATGVYESSLPSEFTIFPNPATILLNIPIGIIGEVQLADILGKSIKKFNTNDLRIDNNSYQLNVADLENGIYILSVVPSSSKKRISLKFIKIKTSL